jgi:hypothetical protein
MRYELNEVALRALRESRFASDWDNAHNANRQKDLDSIGLGLDSKPKIRYEYTPETLRAKALDAETLTHFTCWHNKFWWNKCSKCNRGWDGAHYYITNGRKAECERLLVELGLLKE